MSGAADAAGFAEGFIKTYTAIFKDFTKLVRGSFNLLLKPFTAFTDFIKKPFIEGGSIRKLFSEAIDKLKPQFIDDIVKAFGEGGRVRVLFTTAIDNLKPQFIDDIVKAFGESGSIGQIFTKIKTFFISIEGRLSFIFIKLINQIISFPKIFQSLNLSTVSFSLIYECCISQVLVLFKQTSAILLTLYDLDE